MKLLTAAMKMPQGEVTPEFMSTTPAGRAAVELIKEGIDAKIIQAKGVHWWLKFCS